MKISELIEELKNAIDEHGDLEVATTGNDGQPYIVRTQAWALFENCTINGDKVDLDRIGDDKVVWL